MASDDDKTYTDVSIWQSIKEGFLTGALNPKATVFFVSLFSLVVSPNIPMNTLIVLGIFICIDCIIWFAGLSYFISIPAIRNGYARIGKYIDKFFGVFLV
jgi:threonine/homoserine/homoserine lactone efflux protein